MKKMHSFTVLHRVLSMGLALPVFMPSLSAREKPIAVQMYTLRSIASLEEQLQAVQAAGLTKVEILGAQGGSAETLNTLLKQYSIEPISMHVSLDALRSDFDTLVAFNREVGNRLLVVPYAANPADAEGWRDLGKALGEAAEKVAEAGLTLAYHNHDFEFADFDGKTGFDLLFEGASPALKAELDVAWAARAGHDPAALIRKFSGRIVAIHAKDNAPKGEAEDELGFAAVGSGVLDWAAILSAAADAGVQWYIIEHDQPLDPAASIKSSADFLKKRL